MRKLLIILVTLILIILFLISRCTRKDNPNNSLKQSNIEGYWVQVERDWSGDVDDLTDNPNSFLEVTKDRLFFHVYYSDTESSGVSEKYYKLENNKLYYDYYELKGNDWKENIDEGYGGVFEVSISDNKLILIEYIDKENKADGYKKDTYEKIDKKDLPFEK